MSSSTPPEAIDPSQPINSLRKNSQNARDAARHLLMLRRASLLNEPEDPKQNKGNGIDIDKDTRTEAQTNALHIRAEQYAAMDFLTPGQFAARAIAREKSSEARDTTSVPKTKAGSLQFGATSQNATFIKPGDKEV